MSTKHNTFAENDLGQKSEEVNDDDESQAYFRRRALLLGPLRKRAKSQMAEKETKERLPGEYLDDRWYDL